MEAGILNNRCNLYLSKAGAKAFPEGLYVSFELCSTPNAFHIGPFIAKKGCTDTIFFKLSASIFICVLVDTEYWYFYHKNNY